MQSVCRTCAFTGHRPQKLPFGYNETDPRCVNFKRRLDEEIRGLADKGYVRFISGGAMGMDMFAAESVIKLRKERPWIELEIAVPFPGQSARWNAEMQDRYARMLRAADKVTVLEKFYTAGCMFKRNRYMVDHSDLLLAAYDGLSGGGTAMTVDYARTRGVSVVIFNITER